MVWIELTNKELERTKILCTDIANRYAVGYAINVIIKKTLFVPGPI